jgi:hypothetical protein
MKKFEAIIFIAAVLLAIYSVTSLNHTIANINIPFDTDEADHANAGIELYAAIKSTSPIKVVNALQKAAFYPPIHPILVSISYITLSPSLYSSRVVSVFLLVSLIFILCKLTIKTTSPNNSLLPITFIILCIISSPITLKLSALCMLELCAMNCVALFILLLCRYEKHLLRNSNLFILCLGTL